MALIDTPSWLDKAFLEKCLNSEQKNLTILKFHVKMATAKGDNYTSNMYRVTVETKEKGTFSILLKHLLDEGKAGKFVRESSALAREVQMLGVVLPNLSALLDNVIPGKFEPFGAQLLHSNEGLLVMEDLAPEGFKMAERRQGLDLEHCEIVMRTLARYHATTVILKRQDPGIIYDMKTSIYSEPQNEEDLITFYTGQMKNLANEVETWTDFNGNYAEKIRAFADDALERVCRLTLRDEKAFNVINHGDMWVNNMLFRYSKTGHPEAVRFVDFQLSHFTSPAIDLQYFINSSPKDEIREKHIDHLLQVYHEELCETLKVLGYSQKLITFKELKQEFESKAEFGFVQLACLLPIALSEPSSGFDFDSSLDPERSGVDIHSGERYKKVVKRILPIFDQQGVFNQTK